jgi:hypothetical protein
LFLSDAERQYSVVYRRTDGDYGLIIPEML